jgi:crotonobetainyl-CoA:carnitine CoA-transferase CaiB-like acyl-CoA transferase
MTQHMAGQAATGREPPPMPAREAAWAIYDLFPTADKKQIFIGITSNGHWRRFCEHFGRADLLRDPRFATNEDRVRQRETIRPIVADIASRYTVAQLAKLFDRIGIPFSLVAKPGDLFDDPQLNAQGRMLDIEFGNGVRARMPPLPIEIGNLRLGLRRQAPALGEHTVEVLSDLSLEKAEIDGLCRRGIVAVPTTVP